MNSRKVTPLLLAASVFLTGATGFFLEAMTPAQALTSVDELSDVNSSHWAYEALRDLVEKYDVIEGYPDATFRGDRAPTRWEMAAALNALVKSVGRDLARLGAEKANKRDLETLARLQQEFRNELNALNQRTTALEQRASAIEAKNEEQDNRLTLLEKTQLHGDFSFGGIADVGDNGIATTGNDGFRDGLSTIGRLRLSMDIPVKEADDDSYLGRGDVYARMIAAFGRNSNTNNGLGGYTGYSRIAGDSSFNNEGIGVVNGAFGTAGVATNGASTRSNLYLESAYYKQEVNPGVPILTDWFGMTDWDITGDAYAGVVPWRFLFDKSPYRGNELTQFQNSAFVNIPGVAVNLNQPTLAYVWHMGMNDETSLDFTTAFASPNVGDVYDGWNLTYEGRLNYDSLFDLAGAGSFYAGGYHIWLNGNSLPGLVTAVGGATGFDPSGNGLNVVQQNSSNAFYLGWSQDWYEGIGTTFNYLLSNKSGIGMLYQSLNQTNGVSSSFNGAGTVVSVRQALSGVLNIPMASIAPGWRDSDTFGIGYALFDFQETGAQTNNTADAWTHVMETYYKYQMTESISLVPSLQLHLNRLGLDKNGMSYVLGFRTNYEF
ncbi:MAG: iron uptake porin [Vampirovibrio sp.]|nr:iron uptake porin [Vampirovibrio sp.]